MHVWMRARMSECIHPLNGWMRCSGVRADQGGQVQRHDLLLPLQGLHLSLSRKHGHHLTYTMFDIHATAAELLHLQYSTTCLSAL